MLRTSKVTYSILSEAEIFKVFKNNKQIGTISDDYEFSISESGQKITAIREGSDMMSLVLNNKEIAHMNLRNESGKFDTDRVFSLFHNIESGYEEALLILSVFHVLIKPKLI